MRHPRILLFFILLLAGFGLSASGQYASAYLSFEPRISNPGLPDAHKIATSSQPQREAAVAAAVVWLRSLQQNDGHIGGLGVSCEVTWVVALAGSDPAGLAWTPASASLLDACEADVSIYLARRDAGRMGKVLRAVVAAGADPRHFAGLDLIAELEAKYDPALGLYDPNFFFRQDLAILALHEAGRSLPPGVLPAILAQQHPDGGWSWAVEPDPAGGFSTDSDLDATARTLQVLSALGAGSHPAVGRAARLIQTQQNAAGGWGYDAGPTNANSTALSIEGLLAAGWDPESAPFLPAGQTPVQILLDLQAPDGAFNYRLDNPESRLLATLDAIPALLHSYPSDVSLPIKSYLPVILAF